MGLMDRSEYPTRVRRLHDPEDESEILAWSPDERMAMVWTLTLQAWAFLAQDMGAGGLPEPRLRRDVGGVVRGSR